LVNRLTNNMRRNATANRFNFGEFGHGCYILKNFIGIAFQFKTFQVLTT
jgi:hypothetical protein